MGRRMKLRFSVLGTRSTESETFEPFSNSDRAQGNYEKPVFFGTAYTQERSNKSLKSVMERTAPSYLETVIEKDLAFCNITHYNEYILTVWS